MSATPMQPLAWLRTPANRIWLALAAATLASYTLGEQTMGSGWRTAAVLAVFGLAALKGWWVIDTFMGLRTAPPLWRRLLLGWLLVLALALAALSLLA